MISVVVTSTSWQAALAALVRRREPRGVWLYSVCAVLITLYALSVLYGIGVGAPTDGARVSDFGTYALWLSLPVAVALTQWWRQTLLGWLLLLAAFAVVAVGVGYAIVKEEIYHPWPMTLLATAIAICVGLVRYRPAQRGGN